MGFPQLILEVDSFLPGMFLIVCLLAFPRNWPGLLGKINFRLKVRKVWTLLFMHAFLPLKSKHRKNDSVICFLLQFETTDPYVNFSASLNTILKLKIKQKLKKLFNQSEAHFFSPHIKQSSPLVHIYISLYTWFLVDGNVQLIW